MAVEIAAPLLAMCNIAAGLLIWPFLIVLSYLRKANRRLLTLLLVIGSRLIRRVFCRISEAALSFGPLGFTPVAKAAISLHPDVLRDQLVVPAAAFGQDHRAGSHLPCPFSLCFAGSWARKYRKV